MMSVSASRVGFVCVCLLLYITFFYSSGWNYIVLATLQHAGIDVSSDNTQNGVNIAYFLPWTVLINASSFNESDINQVPFFPQAVNFMLLGVILEYIACQLLPEEDQDPAKVTYRYRLNDSLSSLSLGILNQAIGVFFRAIFIIPYYYIWNNWRIAEVDTNQPLYFWLSFLLVDFAYYWFHRFSHESNLLWTQHVIHHSSEELNLTTALRQPALSGTNMFFYLPLAFFLSPEMKAGQSALNLVYQFWIHTKLIGRIGWLEYILNTPSHHRVHHGRNPECIDCNYGGTLIIWDRIFGTFRDEDEPMKEPGIWYGIVPPLKSFDVIWGNTHEFVSIWKSARLASAFYDKIRFIWRGPSWGYDPKKGIYRDFRVPRVGSTWNPATIYDPPLNNFLKLYCLLQFLVGAMLSFILDVYLQNVFSKEWLPVEIAQAIACALFIAFHLWPTTRIFDTNCNIWNYELLKGILQIPYTLILFWKTEMTWNYAGMTIFSIVLAHSFFTIGTAQMLKLRRGKQE